MYRCQQNHRRAEFLRYLTGAQFGRQNHVYELCEMAKDERTNDQYCEEEIDSLLTLW